MNILEDLYEPTEPLKILEATRAKYDGVLAVVEGPFGLTETENRNKRTYPNTFWEGVLGRDEVQQKLRERACLGEPEHPHTLYARLDRVSHIVTDLKLVPEKKMIWGRSEILDTPNGRILHTLFKAGVKVGISSRGAGSLEEKDGHSTVKEKDYLFGGFDFVSEPSAPNAYPKIKEALIESLSPIVKELERHPDYYEGILAKWGVNIALIREASESFRKIEGTMEVTRPPEVPLSAQLEGRDRTIGELRAQVGGLLQKCKDLALQTSSLEDAKMEEEAEGRQELIEKISVLRAKAEEWRGRILELEAKVQYLSETVETGRQKVERELAEAQAEAQKVLEGFQAESRKSVKKAQEDAEKAVRGAEGYRADSEKLQKSLKEKVEKIEAFRKELLEASSKAFGVNIDRLTEDLKQGFGPVDVIRRALEISPRLSDRSLPLTAVSENSKPNIQLSKADRQVPEYDSRDGRPAPGKALKRTLAKL